MIRIRNTDKKKGRVILNLSSFSLSLNLLRCRNKFNLEEGNEARFNGEAHVSIDPSNYFLAGERTVIQLRIRPEKPDGILVVAGNADRGGEFLTLCLQGGRLILRSVVHTCRSIKEKLFS